MANLSDYLSDTALLLRDTNYQFNSQTTLTRYINLARDQVAKQTGCLSVLIAGQAPLGNTASPGNLVPGAAQPGSPSYQLFTTIAGVEKYSFGYAKPFLIANNTGLRDLIDVTSVGVNWGGYRPSLNWMPFEDFTCDTLDRIARDGARRKALSSHHTQTRMSQIIGPSVEHEMRRFLHGAQTKNG